MRITAMLGAVGVIAAGMVSASAFAAAGEPEDKGLSEGRNDRSIAAITRLLNSRAAGSPRGYEEAAKIVREDADDGYPLQRYLLGLISTDKRAPEAAKLSDTKRRTYLDGNRERIRTMAEQRNNPLAWYLLSLENNDMKFLKLAVDGGNVQALNAYGTMRLEAASKNPFITTNELKAAQADAYTCFKRASDQGDPNGIYNVGVCHMNGFGCNVNENLAFECFRTAAEKGHPEAINNLGGFFRDGVVVRPNPEIATAWFKKSYELGNEYGTLNYALALLNGEGVQPDQVEAAKLLKQVALLGNAAAMNVYGVCLQKGHGVEANPREAFNWFMLAASKGLPAAMDNLSACYDNGLGIAQDERKGTVWKIRARAASGDRNAAAWLHQNGYWKKR